MKVSDQPQARVALPPPPQPQGKVPRYPCNSNSLHTYERAVEEMHCIFNNLPLTIKESIQLTQFVIIQCLYTVVYQCTALGPVQGEVRCCFTFSNPKAHIISSELES
jgi:hypothetical protein